MPKLIDLSWTVSSATPVFPGDPAFHTEIVRNVVEHGFHISRMQAGMHLGTHLDAPKHFLQNGGDVAHIPLEQLYGKATLIHVVPDHGILRTDDIVKAYRSVLNPSPKLLIHTGWSKKRNEPLYFTDFPGFEESFGEFVSTYGIHLIGVDMPSVKYGKGDYAKIHQELLGKSVVIVENLVHLEDIRQAFVFAAFPLKLADYDGSMIRAVAIVD